MAFERSLADFLPLHRANKAGVIDFIVKIDCGTRCFAWRSFEKEIRKKVYTLVINEDVNIYSN
jgi:hypothetical protein